MSGIDSYAKLVLHCDGADASTTFTDDGTTGHTVTANGDAQIDTAQQKFGTGSGLFDGTGDYLSVPDHADWDFAAGDFTVDFWVRFNSVAANCTFAGQSTGGTDRAWSIQWTTSNLLFFQYSTAASGGSANANAWSFAWTPSTATWYHVAVVRNGADLKAFIDGTQIGITQNISTDTIRDSAVELRIGVRNDAGSPLNGWLDELRISKGIARWTANFTPPTEAYSADAAAPTSGYPGVTMKSLMGIGG